MPDWPDWEPENTVDRPLAAITKWIPANVLRQGKTRSGPVPVGTSGSLVASGVPIRRYRRPTIASTGYRGVTFGCLDSSVDSWYEFSNRHC